ncbi:uncharacterized protein LOC133828865 [Humulus lupulus]|uniref:uncharacterized protein LOC133828865 n=1 Tax=Humulus lupulus TaxID=3486 RepID=UPI002B40D9EA|nr:uncharacterized protein LOC133828865 [Humulus lupulus]
MSVFLGSVSLVTWSSLVASKSKEAGEISHESMKCQVDEGTSSCAPKSKDVVYKIHEANRFDSRVQRFYTHSILDDLKTKFNDAQNALFGSTILGHFLDVKDICWQVQVVQHIMLREVHQENDDEIWF